MKNVYRLLAVVLGLVLCISVASCAIFPQPEGEGTTVTVQEGTTPEETTPEETTLEVTEPDFSNTPDPDGTKRY